MTASPRSRAVFHGINFLTTYPGSLSWRVSWQRLRAMFSEQWQCQFSSLIPSAVRYVLFHITKGHITRVPYHEITLSWDHPVVSVPYHECTQSWEYIIMKVPYHESTVSWKYFIMRVFEYPFMSVAHHESTLSWEWLTAGPLAGSFNCGHARAPARFACKNTMELASFSPVMTSFFLTFYDLLF